MQISRTDPFLIALVLLSSGASGLADSNIQTEPQLGYTNFSLAVHGERLTQEEAEQALLRLRETNSGVGTWRRLTIRFEPDPPDTNVVPGWLANTNVTYGWPTSTNVTYEWRSPDGRQFEREEIIERDRSGKLNSSLYVRNEEGYWALLKSCAILEPKEKSVELGVFRKPYDEVVGERIKEGQQSRLLIIQWLSESAARELAKEAKKQLPLLLRPFIPTSLIEYGLAHVVPYRVETIFDEQTGDLLVRRQYRKDGKLLEEDQGWLPVPDLPPEAYAVPRRLKQLRPKTFGEAEKQESKIRANEANE